MASRRVLKAGIFSESLRRIFAAGASRSCSTGKSGEVIKQFPLESKMKSGGASNEGEF